ncbi:MAG: hypothetical protein KGM99_07040 [Burkholderiales bacterium]|nr:hypothetical protein [Burkholderiales bacterium]
MSVFHTPSRHIARQLVIVSSLLIISTGNALAFSEPQFQSAFQQFMQPSGQGAEEHAATAFKDLLKQEPANPLLMVYAGAATSKLAATTMFPWKKMSYAEEGLAMIDKALQLSAASTGAQTHGATPVALEVQFVASTTFLAVPGFMHRADRGSALLNGVLTDKDFDHAALPFRGAVWMHAARLALQQQRKDEARRLLNQVIQHQAPQAAAASDMLKGLAS